MIVHIKSNEEIRKFEEVGKATAEIMNEIIPEIQEGVSGKYIDFLIREKCQEREVIPAFLDYKGFPASCCISVNNQLVHGIPTDVDFKEEDVVSIDLGIDIDGFYGDHAVTIEIGTNNHEEIIQTCKNSLYEAISKIKPGAMFSEIPKIIEKNSKDFGIITNYGGHGISRGKLHDDPFVPNVDNFRLEDFCLKENLVFAIEPMLTYGNDETWRGNDGWTVYTRDISVHFEHLVAVTNDGVKILTRV